MNHVTLPVLEFVLSQPAHKLPAIFTPEKNPLVDFTETPEEVFQEVLKLHRDGWVEAHVIRGVTGKPQQVQVTYVTLDGRIFLDNRHPKSGENNPQVKTTKLVLLGAALLLIITLFLVFRSHSGVAS